MLFTCSLVDAATARSSVFRERGADENIVHRIAEQIILKLTGKTAKLPEITYSTWETAVDVLSGKRITIKDETMHFAERIWKIKRQSFPTIYVYKGKANDFVFNKEISFTNRKGLLITSSLNIASTAIPTGVRFSITLKAKEKVNTASLECLSPNGSDSKTKLSLGDQEVLVEVRAGFTDYMIEIHAERMDIDPEEWRKSAKP